MKRYDVRSGDSVNSVAHRFNTTPQDRAQLNDLPNGALVVGTELRVPAEAISLPPKVLRAAALVDSHDRRVLRPHLRVVVHRGDSLWAIARRHGVDVNTLALMNGLQPGDPLRAGQHLRLTVSTPSSTNKASAGGASHARKVTYTVRDGDTLARIARVFQVTVAQIKGWNSLSESAVWPGQRLLIRIVAQR